MQRHGFFRVAAVCPQLQVADVRFNLDRHFELLRRAEADRVDLAVFPECSLTGYTCGDLFQPRTLLEAARAALVKLVEFTAGYYAGLAVVGLPLLVQQQVFNVAAVLHRGAILGLVPKSYLPNYREFYDGRYFSHAGMATEPSVRFAELGSVVDFGTALLFADGSTGNLGIGVEVCEDLWAPKPPSSDLALAGATILVNLSASPESVGKHHYRRELVKQQSARCLAAYVYAGSGAGESSTDLVFGGHCLIAEDGVLLAETDRHGRQSALIIADVDIHHLAHERSQNTTFNAQRPSAPALKVVHYAGREPAAATGPLYRRVDAHPFVPARGSTRNERCAEIFAIQVAGLTKRLGHLGTPPVSIGVSGGLDSTLGLLVACAAMDELGVPRTKIQALTMPGFGTTQRTLENAHALMQSVGVTARQIDIRPLCFAQWQAMGYKPFGLDLTTHTLNGFTAALSQLPPENRSDLTFENVQARTRTALLMNTAFTVGTGDMSELALGWCTYNADHMSMYNPNVGVPKTLVRSLIDWAADAKFDGAARAVLHDIATTTISPELLPLDSRGANPQNTEDSVGPYELVDFFLYHTLRWGSTPSKILFLASQATFDRAYTETEFAHWLRLFYKRFFASQYKRSSIPDGPKVGSVSLSPRGDWRMPSDASATAWLAELEPASPAATPRRETPSQ